MGTILPLNPHELSQHHFGDTQWRMNLGNAHHLFHINKIESVIDKMKLPLPPHRKTVYDFFFLTEGSSIRKKGLREFNFGANTFFFLPAFQISTHEYISPNAKGFFCHFDAEIFNQRFPNNTFFEEFSFLHFSGEPLVQVSDAAYILNILDRLEQEYATADRFNTNLVATYLLALFTELSLNSNAINKIPTDAASRITERYKNLLAQHIYATNRVTDYASMLAISPDHLNKCVKTTIGKTSQDLLAEMIILEAKVLLRQTNLNISEIAFKFSEANPSDFARFFKNKTSFTPKQYRKMTDFI